MIARVGEDSHVIAWRPYLYTLRLYKVCGLRVDSPLYPFYVVFFFRSIIVRGAQLPAGFLSHIT